MALILEVGAGIEPPLKHSRSWYKSSTQARTVLRKFKRKKVPISKNPTAAQAAIWATRHALATRQMLAFISAKWAAGAAPKGQAWWQAEAAAHPIINYKGEPVTMTGEQFWMHYQKHFAIYNHLNWCPFNPAIDFTSSWPSHPWPGPSAPTIDAIHALSPLTLEVYYTLNPPLLSVSTIIWVRIHATNPSAPAGFTQYESNYATGVAPPPTSEYGVAFDLTPYPPIKPGTRVKVGLAMWEQWENQESPTAWATGIFD